MAAIFVLPAMTAGQWGPVASFLSTAGWAAAAERQVGQTWIVSPEGIIDHEEARRRATRSDRPVGDAQPRYPHVPQVAKTLVKDGLNLVNARRFRVDADGPWKGHKIDFLWQRHDLFHTAGLDLADTLGCPSVLFVPATTVWEAERWGTRRPGWGTILERLGERPALARATVVACGSEEVAVEAVRIGTPSDRIIITPTGVETGQFRTTAAERDEVRARYGISDRFVVGWVGSFRPFHALEVAIEAVQGLNDVSMLFVGDGPERSAIESLAAERGVHAVFTGTVPHDDLATHLSAMDVGLVLARRDDGFHYSPLKLTEYLAAGIAAIAPDVLPVSSRLRDGVDVLLTPPERPGALRAAIERLRLDPALREQLGAEGRRTAEADLSWDRQVRQVLEAIDPSEHPRIGSRPDNDIDNDIDEVRP